MSLQGNPAVNHHWCASSVITLHDFDADEPFDKMDLSLLRAFVVDEAQQAWWGRVLAVSLGKALPNNTHAATVKLRITAPRHFDSPVIPENGVLFVTLIYPSTPALPKGFRKDVPVQVDYVDDNGCW